jgi:single-stranded-DNA-specific exonuclease
MFLNDTPETLQGGAIILGKDDWHEGVLGIVASRLVEKFHRPAILISFHGDTGKGSGRSIPGIHLYDALCGCSAFLEGFGGHAMAAGVRIKKENIQGFRECLERTIAAQSTGQDLSPELIVDSRLTFDMITEKLMDELALLQPFGQGNSEPLFYAENVRVAYSKVIGNDHRRLSLTQGTMATPPLNAIWFNPGSDNLSRQQFDRLIFKLRWNHWNGKKSLQAVVEDV